MDFKNEKIETFKIAYIDPVDRLSFGCICGLYDFLTKIMYGSKDLYTVYRCKREEDSEDYLLEDYIESKNYNELKKFVNYITGDENGFTWGIVNNSEENDKRPVLVWIRIEEN